MSRRTERVASLIRTVVADAIQNRLHDPRIEELTSVTRVEVSGDLSVARVHVSVMADDARRRLCVQALTHAAGRLRSLVAEQVVLRHAPKLEFQLDESVRRGFDTVATLDRIMAREGEGSDWETDGPTDEAHAADEDGSSATNDPPRPAQEDA